MKSLIYKTFESISVIGIIFLFVLLYFPSLLQFSCEYNIIQGISLFCYSGSLPLLFLSEDAKSKWDKYQTVLPVSRKTIVSVPFFFILFINLIQLALCIVFSTIGAVMLGSGFSFVYILKLLACYIVGSAFAGLPLMLLFRLDYRLAQFFFGIFFVFAGFFNGFTDAILEDNPSAVAFVGDGRVYAVSALVCVVLFVLEWFISVRVYSKKDL